MEVGEPQVGEVTRLAVVEIYNAFTYNLTTFLRLLLRLKLRSLSRGFPSSHLEKDERLILGHICLFMKASRVVLRGVWFREEPLT